MLFRREAMQYLIDISDRKFKVLKLSFEKRQLRTIYESFIAQICYMDDVTGK